MDFQSIWHISDDTYNKLKWASTIFLPLFITFVGLVLTSLKVPNADLIISLAVGFNTALGGMLMKSTSEYNNKKEQENTDGTSTKKENGSI